MPGQPGCVTGLWPYTTRPCSADFVPLLRRALAVAGLLSRRPGVSPPSLLPVVAPSPVSGNRAGIVDS